MNIFVLSRNGKELGRTPANKKMLLVGRSPACDIVIRGKEIEPVHFLIEYVGADMPADEGGFWTAIDLTENIKKKGREQSKQHIADQGTGEGIVVTQSKTDFRGFSFHLEVDLLQETEIKKGVLKRHLDNLEKKGNQRHLENVIEVVYFRKDIESVTNIIHVKPEKIEPRKLFPTLPELSLSWNVKSNSGIITGKVNSELCEVFNRGHRITEEFINGNKSSELHPGDLLHIQSDRADYYVRAVPHIDVDFVRFGWVKDPIIISFLVVFLGAIGLSSYLSSLPAAPVEKAPEPRMVSIVTTAPVLVTTPTPTPIPTSTPTPTPVPTATPTPMEVKDKDLQPKKVEPIKEEKMRDPTIKKAPQLKPKEGLTTPAPLKNVNAVGLLGKFKTGAASVGTVSADQVLNQGIVSDVATGNTGFVVQQGTMGVIGEGKAGSINTKGLTAASTTLQGAEVGEADAQGLMAAPDSKDRFSSGNKIAKENKSNSDVLGVAEGLQVQGGLEKDAIRKALSDHKRAIRSCYESALITKKTLEGKMLFKWVISAEGPVTTLSLVSSDIGLPQFETCVGDVIKTIVFMKSPNNLPTTVVYPFVFQGKK